MCLTPNDLTEAVDGDSSHTPKPSPQAASPKDGPGVFGTGMDVNWSWAECLNMITEWLSDCIM